MLKWARKYKLISSTDADLWERKLLLRVSLDVHKCNGLRRTLQGMNRDLPPSPLPDEDYIEYEGTLMSERHQGCRFSWSGAECSE